MGTNKQSYRVKTRKIVFSKGPIHLVDCDVSLSTGRILSRQILEHPGSVVMIPLLDSRQCLLVRQFRFAARGNLWEFPAGGIEPNENLRAAASRELAEEIGFRPGKLTRLTSFYPSPGISSEVMHLYLAESLTPHQEEKDEDEEIEVRAFPLKELEKMVLDGKIADAKTILGVFYLKEWRKRRG